MKRILSILTIAYTIAAIILPFVFNGGIDDEAVRSRGYDGIVYLDSEALALSDSSDCDTGLRAEALEAFNQINEIRADAGLNGLSWDQNLETVSVVRAKECDKQFSHMRPNGKQWNTVNSEIQGGENLAYGFDTANEAVSAWMDSTTHRDNILYKEFSGGSISIYKNDEGVCYWAQEFSY